MRSQRPRQSLTRPLNELNAALWPAFIPLRKSQGPVKSRPNCPAVCPEGVQVGPGVLRGECWVPWGTRRGDWVGPVSTWPSWRYPCPTLIAGNPSSTTCTPCTT
jgi:hypothetical protein